MKSAPTSTSSYQRQAYALSPPAPCTPTQPPPASIQLFKASFCASFSTSPLTWCQTTAEKRARFSGVKAAPLSVWKTLQPRRFAIASISATPAGMPSS